MDFSKMDIKNVRFSNPEKTFGKKNYSVHSMCRELFIALFSGFL
jgi:hypothetical protein